VQYPAETIDEGMLDDVSRGLRQFYKAQGQDQRALFFRETLPFLGELAVSETTKRPRLQTARGGTTRWDSRRGCQPEPTDECE
jgi:hypothetical protein